MALLAFDDMAGSPVSPTASKHAHCSPLPTMSPLPPYPSMARKIYSRANQLLVSAKRKLGSSAGRGWCRLAHSNSAVAGVCLPSRLTVR